MNKLKLQSTLYVVGVMLLPGAAIAGAIIFVGDHFFPRQVLWLWFRWHEWVPYWAHKALYILGYVALAVLVFYFSRSEYKFRVERQREQEPATNVPPIPPTAQ